MTDKRILFLTQESVIHPVTGEILNAGDLVYFMAGASFFYKQNVTYLSQHEVQVLLYKDADFVKSPRNVKSPPPFLIRSTNLSIAFFNSLDGLN